MTVTEKNGKSHFSVKVNSNYQSVFANTLNILLARSSLFLEYVHSLRKTKCLSQMCRPQLLAGGDNDISIDENPLLLMIQPFLDYVAPGHFG